LEEVTVFWKIFPPSMGEFVESSGRLTMWDGQSEAIVAIQVSMLLASINNFALCA
jgi:G-protein coupled receptor 98